MMSSYTHCPITTCHENRAHGKFKCCMTMKMNDDSCTLQSLESPLSLSGHCIYSFLDCSNNNMCVTLMILPSPGHEYPTVHANIALYFTALLVIISAVIRLIVELVQFGKRHYRYFLTVENYIELGAYISSIIFVSHFGHNCWCQINWQWQLGAIGVFLSWINFILFLKRVPLLGIYVLMFSSILWTFLKFALIAFLLWHFAFPST